VGVETASARGCYAYLSATPTRAELAALMDRSRNSTK